MRPSWVLSVAVAAVLTAGIAGCGTDDGARPERDAGPPPHILLVSIDALRADRLEAYGYDRPTSPFLAELGRTGRVFENAFVNTHGTTPSHATLLSGLYQQTHGVGVGGGSGGFVTSRIPDTATDDALRRLLSSSRGSASSATRW